MKIENGYFIWNKREGQQLGAHFTTNEFDCQCSYPECVEQRASTELLARLAAVRGELQGPIFVTSGFRCPKHQHDLLGGGKVETVPNSTHELGHAADITGHPLQHVQLGTILPKHFMAIGTGKSAYHVDLRSDKVRRWTYTKGM